MLEPDTKDRADAPAPERSPPARGTTPANAPATTAGELPPRWRLVVRTAVALLAGFTVAMFADRTAAEWPTRVRLVLWVLILLTSFWGWGTAATIVFRVPSLRGFVRVALGASVLVAISGVFLAAHALRFSVLTALVALGLVAELWDWLRLLPAPARLWATARALRLPRADDLARALRGSGSVVGSVIVLGVWVVRLLATARQSLEWWSSDDAPAYAPFVRQLLDVGHFDQSFSFRRIVAYGGQTILEAFTALGAPLRSLAFFDAGICALLIAGMVLQLGRGRGLALAVALLVFAVPNAALNSASHYSSILLLLLLYVVLREAAAERTARRAALVGVVAAVLCTLRHSLIPGCGALLVSAAVVHAASPAPAGLRERLRFPLAALAGFVCTIAPFALASYWATHTPLFPLVHGYYRGGGIDLGGESGKGWDFGLKAVMESAPPAPQLWAVFVAILVLWGALSPAALRPVALGVVAATVLLAKTAPASAMDDVRYLAAPWIALALAFYIEALLPARRGERGPPEGALFGAAAVLVALQLTPLLPGLIGEWTRVSHDAKTWETWPDEAGRRVAYLALQRYVPEGKGFLSGCDQPYLFNFRRNPIALVDLPSVVSPFPLPGEDATPEQYEEAIGRLRAAGLGYVVFTDPRASKGLYSESTWANFRTDNYRTHQLLAPRFAAWFAFVHYLAAHRETVGSLDSEVVIDLSKVPPP